MSLVSFIQSILTPSGYHAQQNQQQTQQNIANDAATLVPQATQYQSELGGIQQAALPNMTNAVNNLWNFTTQGGRNSLVNQFGQQQQGAANSEAAGASSQWAGNPALAKAFALNAANQANQNTAQYSQQINSAPAEMAADQTAMQAQSQLSPMSLGQDAGIVDGTPPVQVSGGLNSFMQLLGAALPSFSGAK